jgi:GNAT superfamily N-acetyltransferase
MAWETERRRLSPGRVRRGVRALLGNTARGAYFVAEFDGAVVGQLSITPEWSDWRNGDFWWIQSVYVTPGFRRRGVLRALFRHVHKLAKSRRDICGLRLYMHARNQRARRVYERLGMRQSDYQLFEMEFGCGRRESESGGHPRARRNGGRLPIRQSTPCVPCLPRL